MGSTRLPGKMLRPLVGRPLIWHILHRLKKAACLSEIVVATSAKPEDDPLADYAAEQGVRVIRGPEDDVLARFALAAEATHPDIIVRVAGDAPLIDPALIDALVAQMADQDADFMMLPPGTPCIHDGVDPFSRTALETLLREARSHPVAREHVTGYLKDHPDLVRIGTVDLAEGYRFAGARVSVDTPADLRFLEAVYGALGAAPGEAELTKVAKLLRTRPDLLAINAGVKQKSTLQRGGTIVIRCDASSRLGMGHVSRCLNIAEVLRDRFGYGVRFCYDADAPGAGHGRARIDAAGFPLSTRDGRDEALWLAQEVRGAAGVVLDCRSDLSREAVERLRAEDRVILALDDATPRRLAADVAIYPPGPGVKALDWTGFDGECFSGWDMVALKDGQPVGTAQDIHPQAERSGVLLTMGGSDPHDLTVVLARALAPSLARRGERLEVVVGPVVAERDRVLDALRRLPVTIHDAPSGLRPLMERVRFAVAGFGVSAFELAAAGTASILVALDADHLGSASAFVEAGLAEVVDAREPYVIDRVSALSERLLRAPDLCAERGDAGRRLVDGRGAERIAKILVDRIEAKHARLAVGA